MESDQMSNPHNPILAPADIPQVALASMNETHHEEVTLVNRLGLLTARGMSGEVDAKAITQQIRAWLDHTRVHFRRENELMLEYGFPAYPVHKGEHDRVLTLLDELQEAWLEHRLLQPLANFLFETWPDWFDSHVNTMDRVTAQYVSQQGGS
jgi:hemerythrin